MKDLEIQAIINNEDAIEPSVRGSPVVSVAGSRRPSNASVTGSPRATNAAAPVAPVAPVAGSPAVSVAGSRRPSNASSQEGNIIDTFFSAVGISPERSERATSSESAQRDQIAKTGRSRSNSVSSAGSSLYYREGGGANSIGQFDNTSATRTSAKKNQVWIQNKEHY